MKSKFYLSALTGVSLIFSGSVTAEEFNDTYKRRVYDQYGHEIKEQQLERALVKEETKTEVTIEDGRRKILEARNARRQAEDKDFERKSKLYDQEAREIEELPDGIYKFFRKVGFGTKVAAHGAKGAAGTFIGRPIEDVASAVPQVGDRVSSDATGPNRRAQMRTRNNFVRATYALANSGQNATRSGQETLSVLFQSTGKTLRDLVEETAKTTKASIGSIHSPKGIHDALLIPDPKSRLTLNKISFNGKHYIQILNVPQVGLPSDRAYILARSEKEADQLIAGYNQVLETYRDRTAAIDVQQLQRAVAYPKDVSVNTAMVIPQKGEYMDTHQVNWNGRTLTAKSFLGIQQGLHPAPAPVKTPRITTPGSNNQNVARSAK